MTGQADIDNVRIQTGLSPEDLRRLAQEKGIARISQAIAWLKIDFGLAHGPAVTLAHLLFNPGKRAGLRSDRA